MVSIEITLDDGTIIWWEGDYANVDLLAIVKEAESRFGEAERSEPSS